MAEELETFRSESERDRVARLKRQQAFQQLEALREATPYNPEIANMTREDMKREFMNRDI